MTYDCPDGDGDRKATRVLLEREEYQPVRTGSGESLRGHMGVMGRPLAATGRPELLEAGWPCWDICSLLFKASRVRQAEAKYPQCFGTYEHKPVGFNQLMQNELYLGPACAGLAE